MYIYTVCVQVKNKIEDKIKSGKFLSKIFEKKYLYSMIKYFPYFFILFESIK